MLEKGKYPEAIKLFCCFSYFIKKPYPKRKKKIEKKVFYNFLKYHGKRMLTFMVALEEPNGWTIIIKRMFLKYKLILWILSFALL
jgi:hypothetical protein